MEQKERICKEGGNHSIQVQPDKPSILNINYDSE